MVDHSTLKFADDHSGQWKEQRDYMDGLVPVEAHQARFKLQANAMLDAIEGKPCWLGNARRGARQPQGGAGGQAVMAGKADREPLMPSTPAFDLSRRTLLVARRLSGTPTGELIARLGGDVVIADISEERTAAAVAAIQAVGGTGAVSGLAIDIADEASILSVVGQAASRGHLGGVVMSTSGASGKALDDLTAEDFDRANRINLTGSFLLAREAARHMGQGGSIVLYSSMYGVVAPVMANYPPPMPPNPIEYGAGKAGILQTARYLAAHYGRSGIRVNAIVPGAFPTPATVAANPEFIANLERATMLGRIGRSTRPPGRRCSCFHPPPAM